MKTYLIIIASLFISFTFSQDTIYFDADWKKTNKENASFFREVEQVSDSLYSIKDYYISGDLQMEAFSAHPTEFIYEKTTTWYNEDGIKTLSAEYKNDRINGKVIHFLKNGEIKYEGTFTDGKPYSGYILNNCKACISSVSEYKNGEVKSTNFFYADSKQIAVTKTFRKQKKYNFDDLKIEKELFYDKNNKLIATLYYYIDENGYAFPEKGKEVLFYNNEEREVTTINTITTYKNYYKDGKVVKYNKDGSIFSEGYYKEGNAFNGSIYEYNELTNYKDGVKFGEEIVYDKDGKEVSKAIYKNGEIYTGKRREYNSEKIYEKGVLTKILEYQDYNFKILASEINYNKDDSSLRKWYDKEGVLIAECFYKEGEPYEGISFYEYYKTFTPYSNGEKNGIEKVYDFKDRLKKETRFKNDTIISVVSFLPENKQKIKCYYKNDEPYNGEEFKNTATTYKDGKTIKLKSYEYDYDSDSYTLFEIKEFAEGDYTTTHLTTFKDTERFDLLYKDGNPFEGKSYYLDELIEYKNGKKNGPYFYYEEDTVLVEKGIFKDNKKEGIIVFTPVEDGIYKCTYSNGEPIEGKTYNYGSINEYKDGKINGICTTKHPYITSTTFVNGKKEGASSVIVNNLNFGGLYKNDTPYTGAFLNENNKGSYLIENYNEGLKDGVFYEFIHKFAVNIKTNYELGEIIWKKSFIERYDKKDSLIATITYQNNKPYNGKMVWLNEKENLVISNYKKGMLNGNQEEYSASYYSEHKKIASHKYKNNLKEGKYFEIYKDLDSEDQKISGIYKKGKPFKGVFRTKLIDIEILSNYKNGKKEGKEEYSTYDKKTILNYKKGIPVSGKSLEKENRYGELYTHYYKNGKKEKTGIIHYNAEMFVTINEKELNFENEKLTIQILYSNDKKTDGIIKYFSYEEIIGEFKIKNNKIIEGSLTIDDDIDHYYLSQYYEEGKMHVKIFSPEHKEMYFYYITSTDFVIDSLSYKSFRSLKDGLEPKAENMSFTINKGDKVISKLTIKNNRIDSGIMVHFPNSYSKGYGVGLIKDTDFIEEVEDIKYEDIEAEIEKLKILSKLKEEKTK